MREPWSSSKRRERFGQWVRQRASLRLVMFGIVAGTTAAGAVVNAVFFGFGVTSLGVRAVLSVAASYLFFLLLVRLWLSALGFRRREKPPRLHRDSGDTLDALDAVDIAEVGLDGADLVDIATSGTQRTGRTMADAASTSGLGDWGGDGDGDGTLVAILLAILVLVAVLAGGYLIWEAPVVLAETLFEFSLASALARRLGGADRGDWLGHLVRRTWIPFAAILAAAALFAFIVGQVRPDAKRLRDLGRPAIGAPRR